MKFITMHKMDPSAEAGNPPSPEVIERINQFIEGVVKTGVFLGGEGLKPSSHRVRLRFTGGRAHVTRGPYTGENELPTAFYVINTRTVEEAIEWATRLGKILGDAELELGAMVEPWDLGFMPKPDGAPLRHLLTQKATKESELGKRASDEIAKKVHALQEEMRAAKVLTSTIGLAPSRSGARLEFSGGKRKVMDGPFTESKEMIAGFSVVELPSIEEAIEMSSCFAESVDPSHMSGIEIDVRLVDSME
jgi:hypothetical protein